MYGFIRGTIDRLSPGCVLIDTGSVGYNIYISDKTYNSLIGETDEVKLYTYTNVKEDEISLFGFLSAEELDFYKLLIGVNSIGPKSGLSLLSFYSVEELSVLISKKDAKSIAKAPGIGAKSAEKIIIDLKDKIKVVSEADNFVRTDDNIFFDDCVEALMSLGFKKKDAVSAAGKVKDAEDLSDMISKALIYFEN